MAAAMKNNHCHAIHRPRRTLLEAALDPHDRAAIDMVHHLQICYASGLYASVNRTRGMVAQVRPFFD